MCHNGDTPAHSHNVVLKGEIGRSVFNDERRQDNISHSKSPANFQSMNTRLDSGPEMVVMIPYVPRHRDLSPMYNKFVARAIKKSWTTKRLTAFSHCLTCFAYFADWIPRTIRPLRLATAHVTAKILERGEPTNEHQALFGRGGRHEPECHEEHPITNDLHLSRPEAMLPPL